MADKTTRIFISSSNNAKEFTAKLTTGLREKKYIVNPWTDRFEVSQSLEASFGKQLDSNDFFIFLLTPDAESQRVGAEAARWVANENVIFEAGAAYGRYNLKRTIFVQDPTVELPSDLRGIKTIKINFKDVDINTNITSLVSDIHSRISQLGIERYDSRIRWLSLIKCKPAAQRRVVKYIDDFRVSAEKAWGAEFERYGVIWGPPDDFLLFSVPTVEHFIGFIAALRNEFKPVVKQVDSRLIFPNKYWQQVEKIPGKMQLQQLVLLSCAPEYVEKVYEALVEAAKNEQKRGIAEVDIVTVGVATGDADVFFITASETQALHQEFIEKHLHSNIVKEDWLVENTTSLPIS